MGSKEEEASGVLRGKGPALQIPITQTILLYETREAQRNYSQNGDGSIFLQ